MKIHRHISISENVSVTFASAVGKTITLPAKRFRLETKESEFEPGDLDVKVTGAYFQPVPIRFGEK